MNEKREEYNNKIAISLEHSPLMYLAIIELFKKDFVEEERINIKDICIKMEEIIDKANKNLRNKLKEYLRNGGIDVKKALENYKRMKMGKIDKSNKRGE